MPCALPQQDLDRADAIVPEVTLIGDDPAPGAAAPAQPASAATPDAAAAAAPAPAAAVPVTPPGPTVTPATVAFLCGASPDFAPWANIRTLG